MPRKRASRSFRISLDAASLDIGAWDGRFSFLAEKAGAARVVALDHYAWGVDFDARGVVLGGDA